VFDGCTCDGQHTDNIPMCGSSSHRMSHQVLEGERIGDNERDVLVLDGGRKLILNETNARSLAKLFGDDGPQSENR
jgi:hypothetical protein